MMVIGVGSDILRLDRVEQDASQLPDGSPFLRSTYTAAERAAAAARPIPAHYLATRFAGKEAVFKALGTDSSYVKLNEIEILNDQNGQPQVTLYGRLKQIAEEKGVTNILLSLSYDTDYAIAFAIVQN